MTTNTLKNKRKLRLISRRLAKASKRLKREKRGEVYEEDSTVTEMY